MVVRNGKQIRCSEEFLNLIYKVKAKFLMEGKKPPSEELVTKMIAKRINDEEIFKNEYVKI